MKKRLLAVGLAGILAFFGMTVPGGDTVRAETAVEESGTEWLSGGGGWVNPIYQELTAPATAAGAEDQACCEPAASAASVASTGVNTYSTSDAAAAFVRRQMLARKGSIEFRYTGAGLDQERLRALQREILDKAYTVTASPWEGDYLRFHLVSLNWVYTYAFSGTESYIIWNVRYTSTEEEELRLRSSVKGAVKDLGLSACSDAEKVKKIHDYICKHVRYYNDGSWLSHSAYGAMENQMAVCQGYATLFYAMGRQAGLKVRCIPGTSEGQPHLWNIVKLGNRWYNLDVTWDDQGSGIDYTYFLKSNGSFPSHVRDAEYRTAGFTTAYPMGTSSYTGRMKAPVIKSVKSVGSTRLKVTWGKMDAAFEYDIYYAADRNGAYRKCRTVKGGGITSTVLKGLQPGKTYYIKVRAKSRMFEETSSAYSAVKTGRAVPEKVTVSGITAGKRALKVKWKTVSDAAGYELVVTCRDGGKVIRNRMLVKAARRATQARNVAGLKSGRVYRVKVRAYVKGAGENVYGSYSAAKKKMVK